MPAYGAKLGVGPKENLGSPVEDAFAGARAKSGRLSSVGGPLRTLCVLVVFLVLLMGALSLSYVQTVYQGPLRGNSAGARRAQSISVFQGTIDRVTADRLLRLASREDSPAVTKSEGSIAIAQAHEIPGNKVQDVAQDAQHGEKDPREEVKPSVVLETLQSETESSGQEGSSKMPDNAEKASGEKENSKEKQQGQDIELPRGSKSHRNRISNKETKIKPPTEQPLRNSTAGHGRCEFTEGHWEHDPAGPSYRFNQCRILSTAQNCQGNGRQDSAYESYRWQPQGCSVPRFDARAFLELMRGKTIAFVGDSLARNQMESLMCLLFQVTDAKPKGNRSMHRWFFPDYQFTIIRLWSSWLVRNTGDFPESSAPGEAVKLNLTDLDENFAYHLPKFDVTIISSGHWWLRKTAYFMDGEMLGGAGWQWEDAIHGERKFDHIKAYGVAVDTALKYLGSDKRYSGLTILRTYTPDHYSGGSWDTGGSCLGETKPYEKGPENSYNEMMHENQMRAFRANHRNGDKMPNGSRLRLLDVFPILNYRGDGHPGPFRSSDPLKRTTRDEKGRPPPQDCLHWCLPGPMDSMNELLFEILKEEM